MRIEGHHGSMPSWRAHGVPKRGDLVGLELEVFHEDGNGAAADSLDGVDFGTHPAPIAEIDGSLSRSHGVELVLPPLPKDEVLADKGYVARVLEALAKAGTAPGETRGEGYGLHLNFNVAEWSPNEKAVVQYALNGLYSVGRIVARRSTGFGHWNNVFNMFRAGHTVDRGGSKSRIAVSTWPRGKYSAAWIRGNAGVEATGTVLEFRAPRSTLELGDVHLAMNYVYAVRQWAKSFGGDALAACYLDSLTSIRGSSQLEREFLCYWHHISPENMKATIRKIGTDTRLPVDELSRTPYEGMLESGRISTTGHTVHNDELTVGGIIYDSRAFKEQALGIAELFSGFRQIFAAESQDESRSYRPPTAASICAAS